MSTRILRFLPGGVVLGMLALGSLLAPRGLRAQVSEATTAVWAAAIEHVLEDVFQGSAFNVVVQRELRHVVPVVERPPAGRAPGMRRRAEARHSIPADQARDLRDRLPSTVQLCSAPKDQCIPPAPYMILHLSDVSAAGDEAVVMVGMMWSLGDDDAYVRYQEDLYRLRRDATGAWTVIERTVLGVG